MTPRVQSSSHVHPVLLHDSLGELGDLIPTAGSPHLNGQQRRAVHVHAGRCGQSALPPIGRELRWCGGALRVVLCIAKHLAVLVVLHLQLVDRRFDAIATQNFAQVLGIVFHLPDVARGCTVSEPFCAGACTGRGSWRRHEARKCLFGLG